MGLAEWWTEIKGKIFKAGARRAVGKAADGALDDLESALLGEVGAADKILGHQLDVDPLDRIRAAHDIEATESVASKVEKTVADAQAELEKLKAEQEKN